jgi:hypothetical protein
VLAGFAAGAGVAFAAGDANQAVCPNEAMAGFRTYLPDCRAYEEVTPPFKGGNPLFPGGVSLSGEVVQADTYGSFNGGTATVGGGGNTYEFSRGPSGWVAISLVSPLPQYVDVPFTNIETGAQPLLGTSGAALLGARLPSQSFYEADLYLRQPDGSMVLVGPLLPATAVPLTPAGFVQDQNEETGRVIGGSSDLSRIVFFINSEASRPSGVSSLLWPSDGTIAGKSLYEYVGTGHSGSGGDVPALVGVDNRGAQISLCGTESPYNPTTGARGISTAASTVLFTVAAGGCKGVGAGPAVGQLYARVGAPDQLQATVNLAGTSGCAVSVLCDVTSAPTYQGASLDGSKVFFTTQQPLSPSDHDTTTDLYECDLPGDSGTTPPASGVVDPCPSLHSVSVTGTVAGSGFQSLAAVSDDGSHVYFVATGVLTSAPNRFGAVAVEGADNLYVYERDGAFPAGRVAFIGSVSSSELSSAQATPDGRFLVFADAADLTPDDTSTARQVFRYDAQTGTLIRVSIGDKGFNNNGNTGTFEAQTTGSFDPWINYSTHRTVSSDGSRIVFESADGLTPQALDGVPDETEFAMNAYEYEDGHVYLISDGRAVAPLSENLVLEGISPSGRDIFIKTTGQLVPQDTDTGPDLYDVRMDGGFPAGQAAIACRGEACHEAPFTEPAGQAPGSASFSGLGNLSPSSPAALSSRGKPKGCGQGAMLKGGRCVKRRKTRRPARKAGRARRAGRRSVRGGAR